MSTPHRALASAGEVSTGRPVDTPDDEPLPWLSAGRVDSEVKTRITQAHVVEPRGGSGLDYLVVIYSTGRSVRLGSRWTLEKGHVSIGRGSENAIVLESDSVSRRHARIEKRANTWWACDLNSTNGTYV